jgi:hypothetical protein
LIFFGALYRFFKGVDPNLAELAVVLRGPLQAAIYFFSLLNTAA